MRIHGTLTKWNDDRGFGFIALSQSHEEVFVHISTFPKDGIRPRIGETISFEIQPGPDGRKRAVRVMRPGTRAPASRSHNDSTRHGRNPVRAALAMLVIGAIGFAGYSFYTSRTNVSDESAGAEPVFAIPQSVTPTTQQFKCDGRTHCSQMSSCDEAKYFLKHCPNTAMDGNNDGEPCEQQWCN